MTYTVNDDDAGSGGGTNVVTHAAGSYYATNSITMPLLSKLKYSNSFELFFDGTALKGSNTFQGDNWLSVDLASGDVSMLGAFNVGSVVATTIDTGQGANELYDMDQNVLTTSLPTFAGLYSSAHLHAAGIVTGSSIQSSNVLGAPSLIRMFETNGTLSHVSQAASQISRNSSNIVGVLEVNTNAVIALDLRQQQTLNFTNRMTHNTTIWLSNGIPYDGYVFNFLGAVGGGTDYTVTLNAMNSHLICDMTGTNNAVATNLVISVPAGSGVEVNGRIAFGAGTNRHNVVYAKGLH
jgi:hypothetical protein